MAARAPPPSPAPGWRAGRGEHADRRGKITQSPLREPVAAISVGIVKARRWLDLEYVEDVDCDTDMNVVMTGAGHYVEVQGTAEGAAFTRGNGPVLAWPKRALPS